MIEQSKSGIVQSKRVFGGEEEEGVRGGAGVKEEEEEEEVNTLPFFS